MEPHSGSAVKLGNFVNERVNNTFNASMEPHSGSAVKPGFQWPKDDFDRASMEPHSGSAVKPILVTADRSLFLSFNGAALWERGETQTVATRPQLGWLQWSRTLGAR